MTYTITTYDRRETYSTPNAVVVKDRRTAATLDEAREWAADAILNASIPRRHDPMDAIRAARDLPESGGTIGPLPDGTIIEVAPSEVTR